jgi:hypothetical protein
MSRLIVAKRIALCMLAGLLFGVIISEASYYFLRTGETRSPQVVELDIPPGTAVRVARGVADPSLPSTMTFVVGDTLRVRNQDTVVHQLGPLWIPSGATASMKLDSERDYAVTCSFQPSKYVGLRVQSPLTLGTRLMGILEAGIPLGFLIALYSLFAIPMKRGAAA